MRYKEYIGFKLLDIKPLLEKDSVTYNVIELWDTKKTQMGNDLRILNIKGNDIIDIYVAYF